MLALVITAACMKRWDYGAVTYRTTTQPMRGTNFE